MSDYKVEAKKNIISRIGVLSNSNLKDIPVTEYH